MTEEVEYSCGHILPASGNQITQYSCGHQFQQGQEGEVILNSPDQVFASTEQSNEYTCPHGHKLKLSKPSAEAFSQYGKNNIENIEDTEIFQSKKAGPIRVLIPLPENKIDAGEDLFFPADREPIEEVEEVHEEREPKTFEVTPENIDFLTLPATTDYTNGGQLKISPPYNFELAKNSRAGIPYDGNDTQVVNNPGVLCPSIPKTWTGELEPELSTKMNIKRPIRIPWNETNEGVKTTKMCVKAPYKPTWNELCEPNTDEGYEWEAPPKPEFEQENFDLNFPDMGRKFKVIEPDDEGEILLPGKKTILEAENVGGDEVEGLPRSDWNRDCIPENKDTMLYRGIPKPEFEETKNEEILLEGIPFTLDWNKVNEEEAPLSMLLPGKKKVLEIEKKEDQFPGTPKNWDDKLQRQRAMNMKYKGEFIPQDFDMIKEQDFQMPESDDIIVNDDYNTCDNNIVRPVKAVISKINEGVEEEDVQDIDVLEGITRQEIRLPGIEDMLKTAPKKSKRVKKEVNNQEILEQYNYQQPQEGPHVVKRSRKGMQKSGRGKVEYLRDDNYNIGV